MGKLRVYPSRPLLEPTDNNTYINMTEYSIKGISIPKGYETNGADIPRFFWSIIPPFKPRNITAVLLHDYLCNLEEYKSADILFEEVLLEIEDSWKTRLMIFSVKLYHRIRYNVK